MESKYATISSKKHRSAITLEEKLSIIRMYEDGKNVSTIAREINRPISTVNTIVKDKVRIVESMKGAVSLKGTIITRKRQGPISEMEQLLSHWIEELTKKQIPLSLLIIQEKARSLHKDLQEKAGIADTESTFKASAGWFERFKKRTNLQSIKITTTGDIEGVQTYTSCDVPSESIKEEESNEETTGSINLYTDELEYGDYLIFSGENTTDQSTTDQTKIVKNSQNSEHSSKKRRFSAISTLEKTTDPLNTISSDSNSTEHEFDYFAKSIAVQLKNMPLDRALVCQQNLQKVMTEERMYQYRLTNS